MSRNVSVVGINNKNKNDLMFLALKNKEEKETACSLVRSGVSLVQVLFSSVLSVW